MGLTNFFNMHSVNQEAESTNQRAKYIIENAKGEAEEGRRKALGALADLGKAKVTVLRSSVKDFIDLFEQIHNIELDDSVGLDEFKNLRFDIEDMRSLKKMQSIAVSSFQGGVSGIGLGTLAAFCTYNGTMAFGAASTGTAISALHGAAATNATLAFLGGGSLAAGGMGITGGMMVLGGIVTVPFLAVMGFSMYSRAKANKEIAYSNLAEAKKFQEEVQTMVTACKAIEEYSTMYCTLLMKLNRTVFNSLLYLLKQVIDDSGVDYDCYDHQAKEIVMANLAVAKAVKTIIDTPILTEEGALSDESKRLLPMAKEHVAALRNKADALE